MAGEGGTRRLYVGNLFPDVTEEDLKSKFNRYRTTVRLFYIVTRVVFIHVILLTEWFPMGHGCRMHTNRFPFSSVLLFLQYLNLCCKAFQSLYHKPLCRGLGLNPRALRWWEKRLDLSPREVRYFSQILECYLPLHYSPKSFYCVRYCVEGFPNRLEPRPP